MIQSSKILLKRYHKLIISTEFLFRTKESVIWNHEKSVLNLNVLTGDICAVSFNLKPQERGCSPSITSWNFSSSLCVTTNTFPKKIPLDVFPFCNLCGLSYNLKQRVALIDLFYISKLGLIQDHECMCFPTGWFAVAHIVLTQQYLPSQSALQCVTSGVQVKAN